MRNISKCNLVKFSPVVATTAAMMSCLSTDVKITAIDTCDSQNIKNPNIIFILADDLGYADLSCMGQTKFSTPNIDNLAQRGITFTQHYSGSSVSAPSRSCLITGQHTGHTVIRGNKELPVEGQYPLPSDTYTIFRLLKENGYKTSVFGKWGLGAPQTEGAPEKQCVDEFFGYNCQRLAHSYYPYHLWHNAEKIILDGNKGKNENDYAPYLIHNEALDFIRDNKDTTFFMWYTSVIPHAELKVPQQELELFVGKSELKEEKSYQGCDDGEYYKNGGYGSQRYTHAAFASMVSVLDRQVGEISALIDSLGIADNTIIIFTSDNGPHMEGGADPNFFDSNGELRGYKRDLYEGGIRVPFIVKWDNVIKKNTKSDHISAFWDFLPTMADIVNAETPDNLDGISYLPTLKGIESQMEHDYLYWEFHENNGRQAIRKGDWKAVRYNVHNDGEIELYNIEDDMSEKYNLAEKYPEMVAEFDSLMKVSRTESDLFMFE
ncbi:MAG: arylsulfatase [Bacteroidales bacterium]|nr:arylsulfatase [Bacteroidales bacterium]